MEGLIKWIVIGVAGYVVGRELGFIAGGSLFSQLGAGTGTGVTPLPSPQNNPQGIISGGTPSAGVTPTPAALSTTKAQLLALTAVDGTYKANGGKLSYDQWNYFLQKIIPSPIINWEDTPASKSNRSTLWGIDDFWGFVTSRGISGLGMLRDPFMLQRLRSGGSNWYERNVGRDFSGMSRKDWRM